MKATLTFALPEDQGDFDAALLGRNAITALWEIENHCRAIVKHGDPLPSLPTCGTPRAEVS